MKEKYRERFKSKIGEPSGGCWPYMGALRFNGYGAFSVNNRNVPAHRVSYELHVGSIPDGMMVCHTCDRRDCVNPAHLFLGTAQDNVNDMVAKGRDSFGDNIGERNGQSRLTADDVQQIRKLVADGYTNAEISKIFPVVPRTISNIRHNRTWTWLEGSH